MGPLQAYSEEISPVSPEVITTLMLIELLRPSLLKLTSQPLNGRISIKPLLLHSGYVADIPPNPLGLFSESEGFSCPQRTEDVPARILCRIRFPINYSP